MSKTTVKTRHGRELVVPSDEENAEIHAAALSDPDAQPWTDKQLAAVQPQFGYSGKTRVDTTGCLRDDPEATCVTVTFCPFHPPAKQPDG